MSFWLRLGVKINDIECLKQSCRKNEVEYLENRDPQFRMNGQEVVATLRDMRATGNLTRNNAYLVRAQGGLSITLDNDASYSSLTKRLGKNGGRLTRGYAENVVRKQITNSGGFITASQEQNDGSMVIKASV